MNPLAYLSFSVRDNSGNITRSFEVTIRKRLSCDIKPFVLNLDQRTFNLFNQCLAKHNVTSREHDELNCISSSSAGGIVAAMAGNRLQGAAGLSNVAMQKNSSYEGLINFDFSTVNYLFLFRSALICEENLAA